MRTGDRYENVKTGEIVSILNIRTEDGQATVAHLDDEGRPVSAFSVPLSRFRSGICGRNGAPYKTGYIPMDNPAARNETESAIDEEALNSLDKDQLAAYLENLPDDQLTNLGAKYHEIQAKAKAVEDAVKKVIVARKRPHGTYVHGNSTYVVSPNSRFDDATAKKNLPKEEYARICVPKADSTLAKKMFGGEDSPLYRLCQKDLGAPKVTLRAATDKDRAEAVNTPVQGDAFNGDILEDFDLGDIEIG
jgi:hypothetical protein